MTNKRRLWQSDTKKECDLCGHILELKYFYPTISNKVVKYYSRKCRKCTREYLLNKVGEKKCKACGEVKSFREFRPNKESYDSHCVSCRRLVSKYKYHNDEKYRDAHKKSNAKSVKKYRVEKTEYHRKWKKENPDKVKKIIENYLPKQRENNKKYIERNKEVIYPKQRAWLKQIRQDVDDKYVKYIYRNEGLADAPFYLIKLRKLQIISKRVIKQKYNESQRIAQSNE